MRRILLTLLALAFAFPSVSPGNENILRLHVIANSDSGFDQRAKLAVRDAVLAFESSLPAPADAEGAMELVLQNGEELQSAVDAVLAEYGCDYGAELRLGVYGFPERTYSGEVYPAGRYEALRIVLGSGKGHNWWCIMFPPLCIVESGDGKIDYESLEFKSIIAELIEADGGELWKTIKEKLGLR